MVNLDKLAGKIREKRKTQREIAQILGVSDTTVSSKMNGKIKFDCDQAFLIAKFLEMSPEERSEIFFSN